MQSDTVDNKIAALEQKIQDVEEDIIKAEKEAEKGAEEAETEGNTAEIDYWRNKKAALRIKEQQLRDAKARVEDQQQGIQEKQQATPLSEYLDRSYASASSLATDNERAIVYQRQSNDNAGIPEDFVSGLPLAANGRCAKRRCPAPLVHPAFGEAIVSLALPASELEPADWELYYACAEVMAFHHAKDSRLLSAIKSAMEDAFARMELPDFDVVKRTYNIIEGPLGGWVGILGFKCVQASAELQMIALYHRMLRKQRTIPMMQSSTMACATLEVVGCELRLGAFWYEETACAARLGCVELRRNASVEERRAGAAMLRAFLHLVKRLQASQAELKAALDAQTSQASAQPARPLPDAALFRAGIPHVLVSDGRWTQIEQMVQYCLYSAHDTQLQRRVALKLVEHYRPAAHKLWAAHGLAIELLEEPRALPGGFHLLVMPLLTSDKGWLPGNKVCNKARRAAAGAAVGSALKRAHALRNDSGRTYVHGDAQKSNVMLRYNDDEAAAPAEVRLIDMDWSGEAGVDRYLFKPNPMLGRPGFCFRPRDVKCGAVMTQQHDLDTWDHSWLYLY